ncbi:MAG: hypothetical protein B6229_06195 [Spirochaetaceae bacterium 4572_7]|nr:MAG: hypothetical protein B6229_06195 [Spirochaetaceae bacterium 4572_7]
MTSRLLVRLDDASPFMNRDKWETMEAILDKYNIKPIVAIIPNNKDKEVSFEDYQETFWNMARSWEKKGWNIALHGYDHCFITNKKGIVPRNNYSEFAGVSYDKQVEKIRDGYKLLRDRGLEPTVWVAPAHSFDKNTLKALKQNTSIEIVSDGLAIFPYLSYGFKWIPQQVCHVPNRSYGVWTICLHPNNMSDKDFKIFDKDISKKLETIIDINNIKFNRFKTVVDHLFFIFYILKRVKRQIINSLVKGRR